MKRFFLLTLMSVLCIASYAHYAPDVLGEGFLQKTIAMKPDYDGDVVCTLVKMPQRDSIDKAILYVHGFNDYFFQTEMAQRFYDEGYNFYAVDLRKYGRSRLPHQAFFMVRDMSEYFADLDSCLAEMRSEGQREITLMGHSTGGLITALYAHARRDNLPFERLVHNSPFYDFNESWLMENIAIPLVAFLGKFFPTFMISQGESTAYTESLLAQDHGEWSFDTQWKKPINKYIPACWFSAIHGGHQTLQQGLQIPCPVLVLRSDKSVYGKVWTPSFQCGDAVLSVTDIERFAPAIALLPPQQVVVPNGLHDLALSNPSSREQFYLAVLSFIRSNTLR